MTDQNKNEDAHAHDHDGTPAEDQQHRESADTTNADSHDHDHTGHTHDHDHGGGAGHHHHHNIGGELDYDALDPANRSLAEALRLSFGVMKVLMVVLLILFLFSGTRKIDEQHVAVRLMFGKVAGDVGKQVLEPGGPYFWPPEPIGRFILIPTTKQRVAIHDSFWPKISSSEVGVDYKDLSAGSGTLVPGEDGSLITADQNLVHGKWDVQFVIDRANALDFAKNVGDIEKARNLVRHVCEQAIVKTVAQYTIDELVVQKVWPAEKVTNIAQIQLNEMKSGIKIENLVSSEGVLPPLKVRDDFNEILKSQTEKAQMVEDAQKQARQLLNRTIGGDYQTFLTAIDTYEKARRTDDKAAIAESEKHLATLFNADNKQLTGTARSILNEALQYRERESQTVQAEVNALQQILPQFERNPAIALELAWENMRSEVFTGDKVEVMRLPADAGKTLYIELGLDQTLRKRWERQRYEKELRDQLQR